MAKIITPDKTKYMNQLIFLYGQEVETIFAVSNCWEKLSAPAKDKCAADFDEAIIAREALLEELIVLKDDGINVNGYELSLAEADKKLLENGALVRDIYSFDVYAFLNVKVPKLLKK